MTTKQPWDRIMAAADAVEVRDGTEFGQAVAWFLRREAGQGAATYVKLTGDGVPPDHAETIVRAEGGFIIADSVAEYVLTHGHSTS